MIMWGLDFSRKIEFRFWQALGSFVMCLIAAFSWNCQDVAVADEYPTREQSKAKAEEVFGVPKNATALSKEGRIWVDKQNKRVIVDGFVTLREGQLEMFACPVGTKEHESIVAVFASSQAVHAGLLAIGAKQGKPTEFEPYKPATGSTVKVHALWRDEKNQKQSKPAQHWIRDVESNKEMPYDWVFAGSILYKDPDTGEESYLGDSGDMICVANFPTATLDIAVKSIAENSALTYVAYTDHIPALFTVVRLVLEVSEQAPKQTNESKSEAKKASDAPNNAPPKNEPDRSDLFK
jgi:hypothetical protein